MSKTFGYIVAIVAVTALLFSVFTALKPAKVKVWGSTTAGEISYFTGSLNVTHDIAVGEALTAATLDTTDSVTFGGGATVTKTATSSLSAANVCDSSLITVTAVTTTPTITLPATSTLFADCLTTNGQVHDVVLLNGSASTGTIFAAGTGGTIINSSALTIAASKAGVLRIIRDSSTTYKALLINLVN